MRTADKVVLTGGSAGKFLYLSKPNNFGKVPGDPSVSIVKISESIKISRNFIFFNRF